MSIGSVGTLAAKLNIPFKGKRCPAHLYSLERQGDSLKSRFIYRCKRPQCYHYSTLTEIEGRPAQCRNCGNIFIVNTNLHVIKDRKGNTPEEMLVEYPHCCIRSNEPKVIINEVNNIEYGIE